MTSRQQRRADISLTRRFARSNIVTFLCECGDGRIAQTPAVREAITHWVANVASQPQSCIGCGQKLSARKMPSAFLVAASSSGVKSTSAFCSDCWHLLSDAEVERQCLRVLRKLIGPTAHFETPP